MADKKLVISVDTKVSPEVKQLGKMLDDLAARGNKFARAVQGVSGVGPEGQAASKSGGLAKALLQEKKLFEDLGKSGERLAKVLNDQVAKSQATLTKQLEESTRKLDPLMKKYEAALSRVERMKSGGMDPKMVGVFQTHADKLGAEVMSAASEQRQAQAALDALKTPKGVGVMKRMFQMIPGLGGLTAMGAGILAMQVVRDAPQQFVDYYMSPHMAQARTGQAAGSAYMGAASGRMSDVYALGRVLADPNRKEMREMAREGAMTQGVWDFVLGSGGISGFFDIGSRASIWKNWGESQAAAVLGVDVAMMQAERAKNPLFYEQIEALQSRAGRDVWQMRATGMRPDALQSLRQAGLAVGNFSIEESDALMQTLGGLGGMGSVSSTFENAAKAARGGINRQTAASLAVADLVGGGNLLNRGTNLDLTTQNVLGTHVAQNVLNPASLLTSGEGYQGMLGASIVGAAPEMQQRLLAQNMAGAGSMASLFGGADAYQQSLNLVNAIDVLGPNTSLYAQSKLSKLGRDPKVLADILGGGNVPAALQGLGIGRGQVEEYANLTLGSILNRYRETGGGGKGGDLLEKLMKLGPGEQRRFLARQGQSSIDMMAGVLSEVAPEMFADEGAAAGFLRNWGGLGKRLQTGTRQDAAAGTPELNALHAAIFNQVENFQKLGGATEKVTQAFENATARVQAAIDRMNRAPGSARDMKRTLFTEQPIDPEYIPEYVTAGPK